MAIQLSVPVRNSRLDAIETAIGTSAIVRIRSGTPPAKPSDARTGTVLATVNTPSDWMAAANNGTKTMLGTWADNSADASGTAGHYEIADSAGTTVHMQGTCGTQVVIPTTAATAANGNTLTFSATTGIVAGMNVSGTGIPSGATVVAVTGTTVTLSLTSTAGVASGASISFAPDMVVDNANFAAGQQFTITQFALTDANA